MVPKEITSLQHPLIKELVKLRTERAWRLQKQCALISGITPVEEIAKRLPLKILLTEKGLFPHLHAEQIFHITQPLFKKITGLLHPEPLAAVVAMPPPSDLRGKNFVLVLDRIADPGNMGTLLRTALALGWDGAFVTKESVDPYNDKALRAAKGATFFLPLQFGSWEEVEQWVAEGVFHPYLADMEGSFLEETAFTPPVLLILSSEALGARKKNYPRLTIPMNPSMESLNVAAAGAILMYYAKRV